MQTLPKALIASSLPGTSSARRRPNASPNRHDFLIPLEHALKGAGVVETGAQQPSKRPSEAPRGRSGRGSAQLAADRVTAGASTGEPSWSALVERTGVTIAESLVVLAILAIVLGRADEASSSRRPPRRSTRPTAFRRSRRHGSPSRDFGRRSAAPEGRRADQRLPRGRKTITITLGSVLQHERRQTAVERPLVHAAIADECGPWTLYRSSLLGRASVEPPGVRTL